jgi:hypothetical protein
MVVADDGTSDAGAVARAENVVASDGVHLDDAELVVEGA